MPEVWPGIPPHPPMVWAATFLMRCLQNRARYKRQSALGAGRQRKTHLGQPGQWTDGSHSQPNLWSHFGTGLGDTEVPDPALTSAEKRQYWALDGGGLSSGQWGQAQLSSGGWWWPVQCWGLKGVAWPSLDPSELGLRSLKFGSGSQLSRPGLAAQGS